MALRSYLLCLLLCCSALLAAANSGPSDIFNDQDANSVKQLVLKAQKQDGTFSDIKTAHHAVASLAHLKVDVPKKNEVCNQAKKVLSEAKPAVADVNHAASVAQLLGCAEKASAQVTGVIEAALSGNNLHDIYHAVFATTTLKQHITIAKEKLVAAADTVKDLFEADGTVLPHKGAEAGDVYNTGLAYQVLGVLHGAVGLPEDTIEGAGVSWVESAVALGQETDDTLSFATKDRLPLEVTETVLRGFLDLHSAKLLDLTKDQIVKFAEFFVRNKSPADVDSAYHLLSGLNLLSNNGQYIPLVLTVLTKSVSSAAKGAEGNVKVGVTNVLGQFATKARVVLTKANAINDIKVVLFTNQELTPESTGATNTVYTLNFLAAKPEPGLYDLDLKATAVDGKNFVGIDSVVESVAVTTTATPTQLEIAVSDSKEEDEVAEADKHKLEHPETLKKQLAASQSQHIHISFKVKNGVTGRPIAPQQAFVKLTNTKTNTEAILLPKFVGKKYKLDVDVGNTEDFHGVTGEYKIEVIIADPAFTNPTAWNVGTVKLSFDRATPAPAWHQPLPAIDHVFRPDEKRAPASISTVFTGLVFAPVLVLLILVARVGFNFKNFPTGSTFLSGVAFTASLFAYGGLVTLFWLQINLLTTLKYLAVLGLITVFVGNRTLQYLAAARTKRQ